MIRKVILWAFMMYSVTAMAGTDHYLLQDGHHVQHLRINKQAKEVHVSMDVDFEANGPDEENFKPCSHEIAGEARQVAENELIVKRQADGEAHYCQLHIKLNGDAATVEQSKDCDYFLGTFCRFDTQGQSLKRVH